MSTSRLLQTFFDLVRVDSPSLSEAAVASLLDLELSSLGFSVHMDQTAERIGSDCGNLIAELPGQLPATVILSAHMDTVEPGRGVEPVERDGVVYSAGDTVLGADDKVGIAAILESVRRLKATGEPLPTIRVVFSVAEEIGLRGAKHLDPAVGDGDLCLVLDAAGSPGDVICSSPTQYTFVADFFGVPAHAGVAPEKGISAIRMAADATMRMRLGRIDAISTANVGSIVGGAATNVVTAHVKTTGECRSQDRAVVEELRAEMQQAMLDAAADAGGSVEVAWTLEYEGFTHADHDPDLALILDAGRAVGLSPSCTTTGGGSDANIIASWGTPTFALGCGLEGMHSTDEHVAVADIESLTQLVTEVVRRVGARSRTEG